MRELSFFRATFHIPFTSLALTPEACSSYTFPRLLGQATALEMLYFNRKLSAEEASTKDLVTAMFSHNLLEENVWPRLLNYAKLPKESLIYSKAREFFF